MAKNRSREEEPSIAPKPDRWYNLSLGPSFRDHHPASKFCTLRYDFKPASVDKSRTGSLHKTKDNKVTVEFQNNQHGKPKVIFEGVTEDYKDNDAVLFFDGESFCLEQLHRAVKRLRHVRDLSEAAASSGVPLSSFVGATSESYPPSVGTAANDQFSDRESPKIEVENANVEWDDPQSGVKTEQENLMDSSPGEGNTSTEIPDATNYESDEKLDIIDDHDGHEVAKEEEEEEEEENHYRAEVHRGIEIDINIPHQEDEEDFEIADVDVSDGEVNNTGFNAAEALRAQVADEREKGSSSSCSSSSRSSSSSSSSSGSESSSDSRSASGGSSDSGSSHDESVTSI